jgi:hypothetical protein
MTKQSDINAKMREILIDWLVEVLCLPKLSHPTKLTCHETNLIFPLELFLTYLANPKNTTFFRYTSSSSCVWRLCTSLSTSSTDSWRYQPYGLTVTTLMRLKMPF